MNVDESGVLPDNDDSMNVSSTVTNVNNSTTNNMQTGAGGDADVEANGGNPVDSAGDDGKHALKYF